MPPTTYKPTVNVPFHMTLKYIDVWPNDPSKDPKGKGYGASLALRGDINGEDSRVYPKGFLDANLRAMIDAGIIAVGTYSDDPTEKYSIPVKHADIVITLAQPAGERYANTTFSTNGTTPVQATKPNGKQPVNIGGPLPGEYDDEPPHPAETYAQTKGPDPFIHLRGAVATWATARREILAAAPEFADDLQALNAACATVMIEARK
jgi:hypothetical protein